MTERPPDEPDDPKPEDEEDQNLELGRMAAEIEQAAAEASSLPRDRLSFPYPKQWEFIATGVGHRERAAFFGTQTGKTETLCFETAMPPYWLLSAGMAGPEMGPGRERVVCRKIIKDDARRITKKLCGEPGSVEDFGSGFIPRHLFVGIPS